MKILMYNSSARGSGQFIRSLKIAKIITDHYKIASVLILAGNSYVNKKLPDRTDIIRLPQVSKNILGEYVSQLGSVPNSFSIRESLIHSVTKCFNPDLFLVDSRPAGLDGELSTILKELKKENKCRLALVLRDIVDDPSLVISAWTQQGTYQLIEHIYHNVLIMGERDIFNALDQYNLSIFREKVLHIGYIGKNIEAKIRCDDKENKSSSHILITVGGGFDAEEIIKTACAYINTTTNKNQSYTIILGGNSPLDPYILYHSYPSLLKNTQIFTHVNILDEFIYEADLVISMCGYNTLTELIAYRKKIIAIPRGHSGSEQLIRSKLLARIYDGIWAIPESKLTARNLGNLIMLVMQSPKPKVNFNFDAENRLIKYFKAELGYV